MQKTLSKIIQSNRRLTFEKEMDDILDGVEYGSIQYKPLVWPNGEIWYSALVLYQDYAKEEGEDDSADIAI